MKRKKKKKALPILLLLIFIGLAIGAYYTIKTINYHKTYDYKLLQLGYKENEVVEIKKFKNTTIDYILTLEYNKNIVKLEKEKYFLEKNLKAYLAYIKKNNKSFTDVVAIVNVGAFNDWYTNTKKSDTSKGVLMLTNKFYQLDNTYNSDKMVNVTNSYSYGENQMLTEDTWDAYLNMYNKAKEEGMKLIINSSYRSYEEQEEIYNDYKKLKGEDFANTIAAKAGFSEHQTGMAVDIQTPGSTGKTFETFKEFTWLQENAYKYGFILRYPKGKEYLTGYEYESWHYRYVGVEAAKRIQDNDITFDEYYAFFVEKD